MLLTASSMGWGCHLFLFYDALASFMAGTWDDVNIADVDSTPAAAVPEWRHEMARGFEEGNFPSLYEMLYKARVESGTLKVFACSTSCKTLGLQVTNVRHKVDEVVGLHTMMQISEKTQHVLYL